MWLTRDKHNHLYLHTHKPVFHNGRWGLDYNKSNQCTHMIIVDEEVIPIAEDITFENSPVGVELVFK